MDDDLLAKPKRTIAQRNVVVDDAVFLASLNAPVPSNEKVNIEPWNLPDFKRPTRTDEIQSKNQMLNDVRMEAAKETSDPKQVLVMDVHGNAVQTIQNTVPEFQSLVKPKTFEDYIKKKR